jgi:hypothetical protein
MHALRRFQRPDEKPVRIPDIKETFEQMKDQAWPTHGISGNPFWLHSLGIQASIELRVHHHRQRLSPTPVGAPPRPVGVFIGGATRFVLDCSGRQAELPAAVPACSSWWLISSPACHAIGYAYRIVPVPKVGAYPCLMDCLEGK